MQILQISQHCNTIRLIRFKCGFSKNLFFYILVLQLEPIFLLNYPKRTYSLYSCDLDGRRVPPHKILVVDVTTFTINQYGELNITMNWEEPQVRGRERERERLVWLSNFYYTVVCVCVCVWSISSGVYVCLL